MDLRTAFLDRASQELLGWSPAISAYLGSLHLRTIDSVPNGPKRCTACGTILIPSWSCKRGATERSRPSTASKTRGDNLRTYTCTSCGGISTFKDQPRKQTSTRARTSTPNTIAKHKPLSTPPVALTVAVGDARSEILQEKPGVPTPSGSSRKRTKSRKPTGLSSLLAQSKVKLPSTPDLDLMDFMKQG